MEFQNKKTLREAKPSNYEGLADLFVLKLRALYDIESELLKALPKMAKAASDGELEEAFKSHADETEVHVQRIEECFNIIGVKPNKIKCEGIRGIIDDAEWIIKHVPGGELLDANLIAAAKYAEHYEIAGYDSIVQWAKLLEITDAAELLGATLSDEKNARDKLISLSPPINEAALSLGDGYDDDVEPSTSADEDPKESD